MHQLYLWILTLSQSRHCNGTKANSIAVFSALCCTCLAKTAQKAMLSTSILGVTNVRSIITDQVLPQISIPIWSFSHCIFTALWCSTALRYLLRAHCTHSTAWSEWSDNLQIWLKCSLNREWISQGFLPGTEITLSVVSYSWSENVHTLCVNTLRCLWKQS